MKDLLRIADLTSDDLDEAENRMHTAQALLVALALGELTGAAALETGAR